MPTIRLTGVSKRFAGKVTAVESLDLEIPDGSFTTLLGPSGCGKTTTLRMIAGLEMPTDGEITIGDLVAFSLERGRNLPPSKRELGLVFQSYALWPHLTVRQNIAFGLEVQRERRTEVRRRVEEVAAALQIDALLERYTSELSGGQQQRVAIARVLVMRPKVLLLDEPLSNLDATLRMDMRAELKRLHAETGATIVYVTHDQLEALTMSTHIALMRDGRLQQFAPPLAIYAAPANRFAADFLGNPRINLLPATTDGASVHAAGMRVPLPPEAAGRARGPLSLGLRAEELHLAGEPGDGRAEGTVDSVLPTGSDWYFRVRLRAGDGDVVTVRDNEATQLREGDRVWVEARPHSVKVFDGAGDALLGPGPAPARAAPASQSRRGGRGEDGPAPSPSPAAEA